jgi:predicted NAD/FAD-binding protein
MADTFTRREVLRTLAAAAALPALGANAQARRIGIIGGGMAGVSLAWLLDGRHDVVLLEARDAIGGNVQTVEVAIDGVPVIVDVGAQYFHPGPYPLYTQLLELLGLYPPAPGQSHSFAASITLDASGESTPRFVSPVLPSRAWPIFAPWNQAGIEAFAVAFAAAKEREEQNASWALTLDEWLPTLGLSQEQWEGMLLPWAASLFTGSIAQARGFSARAAMIFVAKAAPESALDPVLYYVLNEGMAEPLRRMVDQLTTVQLLTGARVRRVSRNLSGGFTIRCFDGRVEIVDDLILASSGPSTLRLLQNVAGTGAQQAALGGIEFADARLALHTDPIYAPSDPLLWSFLNSRIEAGSCEASMWMGPVLDAPPPATAAKLWKSWITHRTQPPAEALHEASFRHMVPTPQSLAAQNALRALQGNGGIWIAGGYTHPYDSQETALLSAVEIAVALGAASQRTDALLSRPGAAPTVRW